MPSPCQARCQALARARVPGRGGRRFPCHRQLSLLLFPDHHHSPATIHPGSKRKAAMRDEDGPRALSKLQGVHSQQAPTCFSGETAAAEAWMKATGVGVRGSITCGELGGRGAETQNTGGTGSQGSASQGVGPHQAACTPRRSGAVVVGVHGPLNPQGQHVNTWFFTFPLMVGF